MKKTLFLLLAAGMMAACGQARNPQQPTAEAQAAQQTETAAPQAEPGAIRSIDASVRGADILPAIAKNYEGKVVLVDVWATWCGPCRQAMAQVDQFKEEMRKQGCVFVYIAGENSPRDIWEKMVAGITGDHYRLTATQWDDLCQSLNITGIPSYLILGKDGKVAYDNTAEGGYPGSEVLKNNLAVALTK